MKANRDYLTAEKLLEFSEDSSLTEAICFHSGKSAERFLKAFALQDEIPFEQNDSLADIVNKFKQPGFENIKTSSITNYINKIWSPEDGVPSLKEAHEAFLIAKSVRTIVLDKLHMSPKDLLVT